MLQVPVLQMPGTMHLSKSEFEELVEEALGQIGAEIPETVTRLIGEGALGRKAGRGFFAY